MEKIVNMNNSSLHALLSHGSAQERVSLMQLRQEYDDSCIVHQENMSSNNIVKNKAIEAHLQSMSSSKRKFDDYNATNDNDYSSERSSTWDNISGQHRSSPTAASNHRDDSDDLYNGNCSNDLDAHIGKQIVSSASPSKRTISSSITFKEGIRTDMNINKMKQRSSCNNSHSYPIESRMEKNQREKIRSSRIANQIREIHELLFHAGIKCPRGTKGMILSEAAEYIRTLQTTHHHNNQQQVQLQQQLQHQNQKQQQRQLQQYQSNQFDTSYPDHTTITNDSNYSSNSSLLLYPIVNMNDYYKDIFDSCSVGIAICTMGGSILDCNESFLIWSGYTKKETIISQKTLFDFINRNDLHRSFHIISQLVLSSLISMNQTTNNKETTESSSEESKSIQEEKNQSVIVRGLQQRSNQEQQQDWNIRVTLVTSSSSTDNNDKVSKIPKYLTISLVSDNIQLD